MPLRKCPNCRENNEFVIGRRLQGGVRGRVVLCRSCGFGYQNPSPSESELDAYYESDAFFSESYGSDVEPTDEYKQVGINRGKSISDWLESSDRKVNHVLDIGSSYGFLLDTIRNNTGARVFGVEPAPSVAHYASERLGVPVATGMFSPAIIGNNRFDLITLMHVLEHVSDPVEFLSAVRSVATENAVIVVEVPNMLCRDDRRGLFRHFFSYPHLSYFTAITLESVLRQAGWKPLEITNIHNLRIAAEAALPTDVALKDQTSRIILYLARYQILSTVYRLRVSTFDVCRRFGRKFVVFLIGEDRVRHILNAVRRK